MKIILNFMNKANVDRVLCTLLKNVGSVTDKRVVSIQIVESVQDLAQIMKDLSVLVIDQV